MTNFDPKRIEQYIKNATVKIFVDNAFSGTGFFISADGYLLTAYHCVANAKTIQIETPFDGRFPATLHPDKSLSADYYDLAILHVKYHPSYYLPLGHASESQISDNVVAIGYPASHLLHNERVGTYKGHLSRWRDDNRLELSDGIKGQGQSGGAVYHYNSQRVLAVVVERYKEKVMVDVGRAARLDALFDKWPTLHDINRETCTRWDERLQKTATTESKHRIIFAMLPEDEAYCPLQEALREVVEDLWECQLFTVGDRQYSDNVLDNIRGHLEQAHAFIAEVSTADSQVMFTLGAAYFHLRHRPRILLSQPNAVLPPAVRGQAVIVYQISPTLADDLHKRLTKIAAFQQILGDPEREHFWSVTKLQRLTKLPLSQETWQALQAHFPTREAWQQCDVSALRPLLGADADLAAVLLKRIREGTQ